MKALKDDAFYLKQYTTKDCNDVCQFKVKLPGVYRSLSLLLI